MRLDASDLYWYSWHHWDAGTDAGGRTALSAASVKEGEEEIVVVIDEVKTGEEDDAPAAAVEDVPQTSSTLQPRLPPEMSVTDSGKKMSSGSLG